MVITPANVRIGYALNWRRVCQMCDTQKKMLEWIETIVTGYNGTGAELEL
jgi:hypothetical protein